MRRVPENHNPHKPRGIVPWDVPRIFEGKAVCIIGGGPSLMKFDIGVTKGQACIAVNNSYKIAPWSQVLHFADAAWWQWNGKDVLEKFEGIICTATSDVASVHHPRIKRMWRDRNKFTTDRQKLHGWDSGTQAINLAYHMGAAKIILFGIDMQPAKDGRTQWHNDHKRPTLTANYENRFLPSLRKAIIELDRLGVPVVRATSPGVSMAPLIDLPEAFQV